MSQTILDGKTIATVTYTPQQAGDCITDATMAEIVRRLIVAFTPNPQRGNLHYGPDEPADKSSLWLRQDDVTGLPVGTVLKYNFTTNQWEVATTVQAPEDPVVDKPVPVQTQQVETVNVGANGTYSITWDKAYDTNNYNVTITPVGDPGTAHIWKVSQSTTGVTVQVSAYSVAFVIQVQGLGDITPASTTT